MKKLYFALVSVFLLCLNACNTDDYITGLRAPSLEQSEMLERVDGRVALGYVTWYGSRIPDPTYMTHINYAFAEVYMQDGEYVKFELSGKTRERFDKIKDLKKSNPDLKVLLSFSNSAENDDNAGGGGFSALAKSDVARKAFAEDCKEFVQTEGIDGIDIDWEFPGMTFGSNAYDPLVDVDNHVLLMKDLRETLGSGVLLTYAGYCMNVKDVEGVEGGRRYIDVAAVDPYVDYVNIMTYDFAGAPSHQSALENSDYYWDCKRSVDEYLNAGISPSKLVLGIPFYARAHFNSGGSINYCDFDEKFSEADGYVIDNWDDVGQVPYVSKDGAFYAGYDNPESIAIKGEWILGLGMKGMMYWDCDADDEQGTLTRAVWNAVMAQ